MNKKETTVAEIKKLDLNQTRTVADFKTHLAHLEVSEDTIRAALKDLVAEGILEAITEGKTTLYVSPADEDETYQGDPTTTDSAEESDDEAAGPNKSVWATIEKAIAQTDFSRGWKTALIVRIFGAEKGNPIWRHELARSVGSDCKNVHIICDTLKKGTNKYPAMDIQYDKKTRCYTYLGPVQPDELDLELAADILDSDEVFENMCDSRMMKRQGLDLASER